MAVLWDKNMAVRPGPRAGSRPSRALFAGVAGRMGQGPGARRAVPLSHCWNEGMNCIVSASAGQGYALHVLFDDGTSGAARLFGPVFEALRDPVLFAQVRVDENGAVGPLERISLLTRCTG